MDKDLYSRFSKAIIQNEMKKKPHLSEFEMLFRNFGHVGDKVTGMFCP